MTLNKRFYLFWSLKHYFWQFAFTACFFASLYFASLAVQIVFGALLSLRLLNDIYRALTFKPYELIDSSTNQPKTWQEILEEFKQRPRGLVVNRVSRNDVCYEVKQLMEKGYIAQSDNNLCGPIAFLNFLIKHNPALFVKTACEYVEHGCTSAPFYLQSSFWDRWALFAPIGLVHSIFKNFHYSSFGEALAGAFKNTHNLMGYNITSFLETLKGSTKPIRILQWLEQAGYPSTYNITIKNYTNTNPMPVLNQLLLGGLYGSAPKHQSRKNESSNQNIDHCYIVVNQYSGDTLLHYLFNVASGHWVFESNSNACPSKDYIKIPVGTVQNKVPTKDLELINQKRLTDYPKR